MSTCPKCGTYIEENGKFCSICGTAIGEIAPGDVVSTIAYQEDVGFKQMFFRTDGRLNRKRYILRQMCVGIIGSISALVLAGLGMLIGSIDIVFIGLFFALLTNVVLGICLGIRRIHDVNKSAKTLLLSLLFPPGTIWVGYLLLLKKGTDGENQYGPDPLS